VEQVPQSESWGLEKQITDQPVLCNNMVSHKLFVMTVRQPCSWESGHDKAGKLLQRIAVPQVILQKSNQSKQ
jgi:hypothetical protein